MKYLAGVQRVKFDHVVEVDGVLDCKAADLMVSGVL